MDAVTALTRLGGVARSRDLLALTTRRLRRAVDAGTVRRIRRDCYRLTGADHSLVRAVGMRGRVSHLSADFVRRCLATLARPQGTPPPGVRGPRARSGADHWLAVAVAMRLWI